MTFDPSIRPSIDGQTPQPPIDRHLDAVYHALAQDLPVVIDDLGAAARAAGVLFGVGADDAISRIVGRLADLDARARSGVVYLRRAIDDRHAAMLIELDAAHGDAAIHRQLLAEARTELAAATVDALTRFEALEALRRLLTRTATYAKLENTEPVNWFDAVDQAVAIIDGAFADPGNPDTAEPVLDGLRWPTTHAEAGVAPDPALDNETPLGPDGEPLE